MQVLKLRITVYGSGLFGAGHYLPDLESNEEKELVFKVNAVGLASVYVTIKGRGARNRYFTWESSWMKLTLNEEKAEIGRFLVLSNPYTAIGKTISAEATIMGLNESTGLKLEFWVEDPSVKSEEHASIDIKDLQVGEEARNTIEFTPKETRYYAIYAYLYDGWRRIDYMIEFIYTQR